MQTLSELADRIVATTGIGRGDLVIDVGSGSGLVARAAEAKGAHVVCLDRDPAVLRSAPGMRVVADVRAVPLADSTFAAAMTRSCLVWVPDRSLATREIHRILQAGGIFAGAESLSGELTLRCDDAGLERIWEAFREAFEQLNEVALTSGSLKAHLEDAGFELIQTEFIEEIEPDPYEILMSTRAPGGFTLAEFLVAGGFRVEVVEGFADGLRTKGATFISRQALFRCVKPSHASIIA